LNEWELTVEQIELATRGCEAIFNSGGNWTPEEKTNILEMLGLKPYESAVHKKQYTPKKKRVRNR